jgi:tetratricopeptide (TPR) repeat protein
MSHAGRLRGTLLPTAVLVAAILAGCGSAEARKERYLEKAEALVEQRDFEKAQLELRNALQIDPNYLPAQLLMGQVAERLGDPRRALQMYQAALDQDETSTAARAGLAKIYVFGGLPDKALELVEPGLATTPDDARLLTVRGAAKARLGDTKGAIADAEKALARAPAHEDAVALLASLYAREGRAEDAQRIIEEAIATHADAVDLRLILADIYLKSGKSREAEEMLRSVVRLQPDELAHRYTLARFLVGEGQAVEAEQVLREAVDANPDSLEAKAALVNLLASRESFEAAEKELLAYVDKTPKDMDLRLFVADFYASRGKIDQATDVYREVIRADDAGPKGLAARNRLAAIAVAGKRIDEASRLIAEVLEANPQDNDALVLRADLALAKGDAAAAVADLRAVLRDQPTSVPVQRALAQAYLQSGDVALAEETLKKAIELSPGDPQLRVDLAQVLVRGGQDDRALKTLQDAVAESPESLAAQEQIFRIQIARNDLKGARETADAVKSARPDLPLGDFLAGLVNQAEGRKDAAMASFEAAIKLQPNAAEPLAALTALLVVQGRSEDAIARLRRVSEEQPRNAAARNLLGEVLASRTRMAEATAAFDEAIGLAPAWWVPHRGKAAAQVAAGDSSAAEQTLRSGLEASGGAVPLGIDLAALQERLGRPDESIKTYESMLERSPSNDALANNLAMLLATYRSDSQSLERARQLSDRFKDSSVPAYANTAGWVAYKLGRYEEAVPLLKRASDQQPEAPLLRYHLAMAQYRAGQVDDARRNLEEALKSGARFPGADEARATLEQLKSS